MNREQLQHVLRAASRIVHDFDAVVIGSQSILGSHDERDLPDAATRSIEVDIAFLDDPDSAKSDAIDGAIGELSRFHESFGFYGQGVSIETAVLPGGWKDRLLTIYIDGGAARAMCLDSNDCVVAKLVADRPKDREFGSALIQAGLVDPAVLIERVALLPSSVGDGQGAAIKDWIRRQI
ncbi:MAG: DUF6036 family nucleotidyltransferase [Candidatus Limnocylindrales bacterium]